MLGLTACKAPEKDKKISIVCTVFPIYDWARNILGEEDSDISLKLLVKGGTDSHSYSPTPKDIVEISSCDMLIYVGGESDAWISEVLENSALDNVKTVDLLTGIGDRALDEECDDEDCHDHSHGHDEHIENAYDEHVWLSLKNAELLCDRIADELCRLMPRNEKVYRENAEGYINKISNLDARYAEAVAASPRDTLIFADRFPFKYLVEDYGIKYFAAFSGCSADSEASVEVVVGLAKKIDELGISKVIILESSDTALAETVISSSKAKSADVISLESMQSVSASDVDGGASYLSIMENNLLALRMALA